MMRKILFLFLASYVLISMARDCEVLVTVVDDLGQPISNAVVSVSTQKKLIFGYGSQPGHFEWTSNRTDSSGMATIRFKCLTADFKCFASSPDHYSEHVPHGRFPAHDDLRGGVEFDSTKTNLSFMLRRRINPVPMYSFGALTKYSMPSRNGSWGFDLQFGDWVFPNGKGKVADFEIEYNWEQSERDVRCFGKIVFKEPLAGAYRATKIKSDNLCSVYVADTNRLYQSQIEYSAYARFDAPQDGTERPVLSDEEYLVIRSRVKTDGNGHIVSANYSKIYGPFRIGRELNYRQSSYNPNENDPNIEFDIGRNLNRTSSNRVNP